MVTNCYGRCEAELDTDGVRVGETRHEPGLRTPMHSHDFGCLHFVLEGVYAETTPSASYRFGPGSLLYRPPTERHCNDFTKGGARTLRFELRGPLLSRFGSALPTKLASTRSPFLAGLARRVRSEVARPDSLSPLVVESLAVELLASVARLHPSRQEPSALAREAARIVDRSFREPVRTSKLASSLGVDRSTLARAFRRELDCTVGEYVRARRLDFVHHRLTEDPGGSLAGLAAEAGFSDQSHMTRWFKAVYGTSPAALRSRHRPDRVRRRERS